MGLTNDPNDPALKKTLPSGQQETYLVLSKEERAKGFVRPVRYKYKHVGIRPQNPLRPLTEDERERYEKYGYAQYEAYPDQGNGSCVMGRFWTQAQLESGCGTETSMADALAETWARDVKFYGATFCAGCGKHFPAEEFIWTDDGTRVGS